MIIPSTVKFYLCLKPTDMRKGFIGLSNMIINELGDDPLSGHFYVFMNKAKNRLKILYWDRSGYAIWFKQLQEGKFLFPSCLGQSKEIDATTLNMILEGVDLTTIKYQKRFKLSRNQRENIS